jgi:curved DNA-binding protein CbpA
VQGIFKLFAISIVIGVFSSTATHAGKSRDYYEVFGVARTASQEEIRTAYRRLAREYHPDRAIDKKLGEEKFKELANAYEVLSDPNERAAYDQLGSDFKPGRSSAQNMHDAEFRARVEQAIRQYERLFAELGIDADGFDFETMFGLHSTKSKAQRAKERAERNREQFKKEIPKNPREAKIKAKFNDVSDPFFMYGAYRRVRQTVLVNTMVSWAGSSMVSAIFPQLFPYNIVMFAVSLALPMYLATRVPRDLANKTGPDLAARAKKITLWLPPILQIGCPVVLKALEKFLH